MKQRFNKSNEQVTPNDKIASISEDLCIGCGICVKKCPFDAIQIINLPANLEKETTHRKVMTLVAYNLTYQAISILD